MKRKRIYIILVLVAIFLILFFSLIPWLIDSKLNRVRSVSGTIPSEKAKALHKKLFIIDLHCDFLLWNRDFLEISSHGHVDLPRLLKGNVALQVFTAVTQIPLSTTPMEKNDDSDKLKSPIQQPAGQPAVLPNSFHILVTGENCTSYDFPYFY